MDRELLGRSLAYHGTYMLDQLRVEEQLTLEDVIALKSAVPIPVSDEPQLVHIIHLFVRYYCRQLHASNIPSEHSTYYHMWKY